MDDRKATMASVEKRLRDGRTAWLALWRGPDGKQHKKTFRRRVDAERHLISVESGILVGTYVDPALATVTVGEWSRQWLGGQVQLNPSTLRRYEGLLRVQVLQNWERVPLSAVAHADVAAWAVSLSSEGLAGSTVRQAHRVLWRVLSLAVRDGRLPRNPAAGVPLPRARRSEKRFLSHKQFATLANACEGYGIVVRTLAHCGLRYGELAALRVGRVDLVRQRLTIAEWVTEVDDLAVFGTPKNDQVRSVPVPTSRMDQLAGLTEGKSRQDLVFTSPEGGPLRLMNCRRRVFDPAAASVGLSGLTPHELRHTAASLAISASANVKAVQRLLGHASAAITLDIYSGLFDADLDAVAERLDAAAVVPPPCPEPTEEEPDDPTSST